MTTTGNDRGRPGRRPHSVDDDTTRVPPTSDVGREAAPFQVMPPLTAEEYEAVLVDIAAHGVRVPVDVDQHGRILDGHHHHRAPSWSPARIPVRHRGPSGSGVDQ